MSDDKMRDIYIANLIAKKAQELGGSVYYVGGFVRDAVIARMQGQEVRNKDIDIEVYKISPEKLQGILEDIGTVEPRFVGGTMAVLNIKGYDIDIAMPRKEVSTGEGHKDFAVMVNPYMEPEQASKRRDFTMNALMMDVLSGEILDFHGGLEDIKAGVIKHVDEVSFREDPLRVMRAAQFAARFGFEISDETRSLCRTMDLTALSKERIAGETDKALIKAKHPSIFFKELDNMHQLGFWFPELEALINCPQPAEHHPEGDAFDHTMLVLDQAARVLRTGQLDNPEGFMLSALCHDLGKALTTEYDPVKDKYTSIDHDRQGITPAKNLIRRIWNNRKLEDYVVNMTELHMQPMKYTRAGSKDRKYMEMFDRSVDPKALILLSVCDHKGRGIEVDFSQAEEKLWEELERYKKLMKEPMVTGDDLINMGYDPGPRIKEMLDFTRKQHLAGILKDEALKRMEGQFGHHSFEGQIRAARKIKYGQRTGRIKKHADIEH